METKRKLPRPIAHFLAGCVAIQGRREARTKRFAMTNILLCVFYPIFIVFMTELIQAKYPSKVILFITEHPTVMLFDILIAALIFFGLMLIMRSSFFPALIQSVVYVALSITELFKYNTNGNHLIMTDMKLARSLKSLTAFAYIKITPRLVICVLIIIAYLAVIFFFNPKLSRKKFRLRWRWAPGIVCIGACAIMFFVPPISNPVYKLFGVDTDNADNTFILNEKFDENGFLAFFMQTATENLSNKLEEPENYAEDSDNTVAQYLALDVEEHNFEDGVKPNVVEIMSESYADFRIFSSALHDLGYDDLDQYYTGWDEVKEESWTGKMIVPTYASYTVRTEFELLFGLPVKSINDPNMPQRVLLERNQPTVPAYYKDWGYTTAYVHPYLSSFYNRKTIYGRFTFDTMIFENDFTVPVTNYGEYIDDAVVYNQIEDLIETSEEPLYVHATTMQNHQPYDDDDSDDEFINYLSRISHSTEELAAFLDRLSESNEPTIVIFVGDHFPSLRGDDGIYSQLNITSENCSKLYEESYIIYANYDLDTRVMPSNPVSAFYTPYLIMEMIDAPRDSFTQAMMDEMLVEPVYSTNYKPNQEPNDMLDTLTYDRVFGDIFSPSALDDLYDSLETGT